MLKPRIVTCWVNDTHLPSSLSEPGVLWGCEEPLDGRWGGSKVVGGWRSVRESKHLENTGCRIQGIPTCRGTTLPCRHSQEGQAPRQINVGKTTTFLWHRACCFEHMIPNQTCQLNLRLRCVSKKSDIRI